MSASRDAAFYEYVQERYKGKVYRIERIHNPMWAGVEVHVMFRMPDGIDEIEMYRRINHVIDVIAEG